MKTESSAKRRRKRTGMDQVEINQLVVTQVRPRVVQLKLGTAIVQPTERVPSRRNYI